MHRLPLNRLLPVLCACAVVVFALQVFSDNKADVDIWGNVGFVRKWPTSAGYHYTNTYSFTQPDFPWVNHEWGGEYLLNRAFVLLGNPGLLALKMLLGLAVLYLVHLSMRRDCRSGTIRVLYLVLIISTMGYGFSTRPHHFTYLMIALLISLFTRWQHRVHPALLLAASAVIGLVWANLHGAFFIGVVILLTLGLLSVAASLFGHGERTRVWLPWAAAAVFFAATLINPYGLHLWDFIFQSAAKSRPYLSEWAPFHPVRDFFSHVDFMVLTAISLLGVLLSPHPRSLPRLGLLALALASALALRRNIPVFAIVAGLLAARHVDGAFGTHVDGLVARLSPRVPVILLALFIPLSIAYGFLFNKTRPFQIEVEPHKFPVRTMAFMEHNKLRGNALLFFDWAEYCIWHLHPDVKVFLDGRFRSAYSPDVIEDYLDFIYARGDWADAIDKYPTDILLLHPGNPVCAHIARRPDWVCVHQTPLAVLFLRRSVHAEALPTLRPAPNVTFPVLFP